MPHWLLPGRRTPEQKEISKASSIAKKILWRTGRQNSWLIESAWAFCAVHGRASCSLPRQFRGIRWPTRWTLPCARWTQVHWLSVVWESGLITDNTLCAFRAKSLVPFLIMGFPLFYYATHGEEDRSFQCYPDKYALLNLDKIVHSDFFSWQMGLYGDIIS